MTFVLSVATSGWQWRQQDRLCTTARTLCACRTLWVSLFPQRLILSRFGCFVIHDSLVATPTRHSLISGVVCTLGAQAAHKLGARAAGPQRFTDSISGFCISWSMQRLHLNSKHGMHRFRILSTAKQPGRYAHAVPCRYRCSLNGSS